MNASAPSSADRAAGSGGGAWRALGLVWAASAAVLAASVLATFRLSFADDLPTLLIVNGPRVLFAAVVGGSFALSGALRLTSGAARPLGELEILALSTGAAGGGFLLAGSGTGTLAWVAFLAGAALGAALLFGLVRFLDRPKRWTNLGVAALLAAMIGIAAVAGSYARVRRDLVAPLVTWLLGDLAGASVASGLTLLALLVVLLVFARRSLAVDQSPQLTTLSLLALGFGVGAAGPLAFVGTLVPRTVRWLAGGASERALVSASVVAGAATVVAIDAVPRLLIGGYDFPFNVGAGLLAVPIFLGWNRARLRQQLGPARRSFEALELAVIVAMTLMGVALAYVLTNVIRQAT